MLFNSLEFIFLFLPTTVAVFFLIPSLPFGNNTLAKGWLILASLFFYSWWNPANLPLILVSIGFNYLVSQALSPTATHGKVRRRGILAFAIALNLLALGYFKYYNFLIENLSALLRFDLPVRDIALPLAISFFTFQQVAYLVESYRGTIHNRSFLSYALFVSFFPQLIAGPIVRHQDVIDQFESPDTYRLQETHLAIGTFIFSVGLFKKAVFADRVAVYASPVFEAAAQGLSLSFFEAWVGALAYTFQLYFDFSGYTDMAIGAAYIIGIQLPINFNSPYKATSISDFWRRWHITLSNFLRDYLYIPLGGNRRGRPRQYANLLTTMLLGGLWHGAGWTYILWGGLHGMYLVVNHFWTSLTRPLGQMRNGLLYRVASWLITFLAVVISWVFFRAPNIGTALSVLGSMAGLNGISLPRGLADKLAFLPLEDIGIRFSGLQSTLDFSITASGLWLMALMAVALLAPNSHQLVTK